MHTAVVRRVVPAALALLVLFSAALPVDARQRPRKIEPRGMTPYRIGRVVTPSTDILSRSGYAAWMIDDFLARNTPLRGLGSAFVRAEQKHGLNARYFVAHAMLESGWGTSDIARYKRNLFGYNAYDRDPWKHAARYRSFEAGIMDVAGRIRERYLTPGGRWWYGYTTLRAMNMYYASDVRWADKIAVIANQVDRAVVTLKERRLRFGRPELADTPIARGRVAVDVPWRARAGRSLPAAIRFRVRWVPVALVEAAERVPRAAPVARWTMVRDTAHGRAARLSLRAPGTPGVWRLDIEARDSDGRALPPTDQPKIRSVTVRVASAREVGLGLAAGRDGTLAATIRNLGRRAIAAEVDGTATLVEAWALPLDPDRAAYRLGVVPLRTALRADRARTVRVAAPKEPAVVVLRLAGDPSVARTRPAAALVMPGRSGRPTVTALAVAGPRDDRLLGRSSVKGRIVLAPRPEAGTVRADVAGGAPAPEMAAAVASAEGAPGHPWLLVRSLATEIDREADPSASLSPLPEDPTTAAVLDVAGLPAGIRLVLAAVVPADGTAADPRTLRLAWLPVATVEDAPVAPH